MPDTATYYAASPTLSLCIVENTVIALDIEYDRFFALTGRRGSEVLAAISAAAGKFTIPVVRSAAVGQAGSDTVILTRCDVERAGTIPQALKATASEQWYAALLHVAAISRLRWVGLARSLKWALRQTPPIIRSPPVEPQSWLMERLAGANRSARAVLPFSAPCLPHSLALARPLTRSGIDFSLVFGVKLNPFGAHCWVEAAGMVLNDDPATVRVFNPIRVLRPQWPE